MNRWFFAAWAIFFVGFLVAVPYRVMLLMTAVDAETGFYNSGNVYVYLFNGLLVLLTVLLFFLPMFQREMTPFATTGKSNILPGVGMLLAGLAIAYNSITELLDSESDGALMLISKILGILAGFILLVTAFRLLMNKQYFAKPDGMYLLILPAWSCIHLLEEFMQYKTVSGVSERILDIMTACGGTLMLFFLSALLCGVNTRPMHRMMMSSSLVTCFFGLVANLPRILILLLGSEELKEVMLDIHLPNFGLAILAFLLLIWYLTVVDKEVSEPPVKEYTSPEDEPEVLPEFVEGEDLATPQPEDDVILTPEFVTPTASEPVEPEEPEESPELPEGDEDVKMWEPSHPAPEEHKRTPYVPSIPVTPAPEPVPEPEPIPEPVQEPEPTPIPEPTPKPIPEPAEAPAAADAEDDNPLNQKLTPEPPVVEKKPESAGMQQDENGYTILPSLADLVTPESDAWTLDKRDK